MSASRCQPAVMLPSGNPRLAAALTLRLYASCAQLSSSLAAGAVSAAVPAAGWRRRAYPRPTCWPESLLASATPFRRRAVIAVFSQTGQQPVRGCQSDHGEGRRCGRPIALVNLPERAWATATRSGLISGRASSRWLTCSRRDGPGSRREAGCSPVAYRPGR